MAGNIMLEVVTPDQSVVSEEAQIVVAPGEYGEFGVLIGHTSLVLPNKVTILAESAERRRDIDVERAKSAVKRAEERLAAASKKEDIDFKRAQIALQRALARLKVVQGRTV
jgi:F-type H+-transporting ATPase subunit epsilon